LRKDTGGIRDTGAGKTKNNEENIMSKQNLTIKQLINGRIVTLKDKVSGITKIIDKC
jgi:hypothetical protein